LEDKLQLGDLEIDIFKMSNQDRSFLTKVISHLKMEYFESKILGKVFRIYQEFFNKFNKIPTRKIIEDLIGKMGEGSQSTQPILDQIFSEAQIDTTEKDYILSEVIKFGKRARMKDAIMKSVDLLEKDDFESITSEVRDALVFNLDTNIGYDLYDIDLRYKNLKASMENRVSTRYAQLDRVLNGGWAKKELYAFMGPPGIGKSIFLPNVGLNALLNGLNVAHYSMEMSEDRLGQRYDAIATNINIKKLIDHPEEIKKKYETIRKITTSHLKLKEFPTSLASVLDIESHLDELKLYQDFTPDLIIVDYGDIMRSTRKTNNLYEEQGWIFRELRGLAVKRNLIVITATQANRESMDGEGGTKEIIGMEKTADSMEKNRILDALFSITQKRQEKDQGKINLWVAKNRNGESNIMLEFLINYTNMQIKEALLGNKDQTENSELELEDT
jgi:replicative DNA helicase